MADQGEAALQADDTRQRIRDAASQVCAQEGCVRRHHPAPGASRGRQRGHPLSSRWQQERDFVAAVIDRFGGAAIRAALESQFRGNLRHDLQPFGRHLLEQKEALRHLMLPGR
jgi:hypothetical protein